MFLTTVTRNDLRKMSWLLLLFFVAVDSFSPPRGPSFFPSPRRLKLPSFAVTSKKARAEAAVALKLASNGLDASATMILESLNKTLIDVANDVEKSPLVELLLWTNECPDRPKLFRSFLAQGCDPQPMVHNDRLLEYYPELLKVALDYGALPDVVDNDGRTALEKVIVKAIDHSPLYLTSARILLDKGADPNKVARVVKGKKGDTLLALALRGRAVPTAELLLDYGADPTVVNSNTGESAIEVIHAYFINRKDITSIDTLVKKIYSLK